MKNKLEQLKKEALSQLNDFLDRAEQFPAEAGEKFKELEQKFLGRKGELAATLKDLKDLGVDLRKECGELANNIKKELEENFSQASQKPKIIQKQKLMLLCLVKEKRMALFTQ